RPQHSSLFSAVEGSASADMPASIFEEPAVQAQPSVLVPVQKYVAAKRRQLIFGLILGICISSMFAMAALKFSNYLRQSRGPEKVAGEARTAGPALEIKQAVPAPAVTTPAVTNPGSTDVFSGSNQQKASSPSRVLNPQLATATPPARSHTMEPAKPAAASAPPPVQQHSSEIASKSQPSRTPEQLWASVQAGNSKAARLGPAMRHCVCFSARRMCWRSASSSVEMEEVAEVKEGNEVKDEGSTPEAATGTEVDFNSPRGTRSSWPGESSTARSMRFS